MQLNSPLPVDENSAFRDVPKTGVIYVMSEAAKLGFNSDRNSWANLGQGAPETSALPDAPERLSSISFNVDELEYSPVVGLDELREAVAELYNRRYRAGKQSTYTKKNVAICSGGRLSLTRLVSTLGHVHLGHFLPDYTAYEELLDCFGRIVPIPILLSDKDAYNFSAADLEAEILGKGLSAVLLSNPCNPTGCLIQGESLGNWLKIARSLDCTLIFDEFYSHYVYQGDRPVSAAEYVKDVNKDSVILFDGLTKNWRYPGFRVAWTLGPEHVIERLTSAGSFLDGGCAQPMQRATLQLLEEQNADREAAALRNVFSEKRSYMVENLRRLGIEVDPQPQGTFYCWGKLSALPKEIRSGQKLFEAALKEKTVIVPGVFFDVNPGKRRPNRTSRFEQFARFSFGPSMEELHRGIAGLERTIQRYKA